MSPGSMESKGSRPALKLSAEARPLVRLYFEISYLKQLYRQGWLQRGISPKRCESVADHVFGVALLALLLTARPREGMDPLKVIRIALLHDLGEYEIGDLTPADEVTPREKVEKERDAVRRLLSLVPDSEPLLELWEDYQKGASPEARLVKQLDKLEMALQAGIYQQQDGAEVEDFYASAERGIADRVLLDILREIRRLKK